MINSVRVAFSCFMDMCCRNSFPHSNYFILVEFVIWWQVLTSTFQDALLTTLGSICRWRHCLFLTYSVPVWQWMSTGKLNYISQICYYDRLELYIVWELWWENCINKPNQMKLDLDLRHCLVWNEIHVVHRWWVIMVLQRLRSRQITGHVNCTSVWQTHVFCLIGFQRLYSCFRWKQIAMQRIHSFSSKRETFSHRKHPISVVCFDYWVFCLDL